MSEHLDHAAKAYLDALLSEPRKKMPEPIDAIRDFKIDIAAREMSGIPPNANAAANSPTDLLSEQPVVRDPELEARDAWLYEACCKLVAYSKIVLDLSKRPEKWAPLSISGVRKAARNHAERHNLAPIPHRQRGRKPSR